MGSIGSSSYCYSGYNRNVSYSPCSEKRKEGRIDTFLDWKPELKKPEELSEGFEDTKRTLEFAEADKQSGKLTGKPIDYMRLGEAEYSKRNYETAIEYYDKALKLKQDYVWALVNKCYAFRKQNQYEEALKSVDKAIELKPNSAWIWDIKVYVLRELGNHEEALKAFEKVNELRSQE